MNERRNQIESYFRVQPRLILYYRFLVLFFFGTTRHLLSTFKLEGKLVGYHILLLVDSGTSHNFIARKLVSSLNLDIMLTQEFCVGLGNGYHSSSQRICKDLRVKLGRYTIIATTYVLDLGGVG